MHRSSVDLPEPDAPISVMTSPLVHVEVDAVEHHGGAERLVNAAQ